MSHLLLDAVADIGHAYLFLFGVILVIPFVYAGITVYRIIKDYINQNKVSKFNISYNYPKNNDYERNLLLSIDTKLKDGFGIESFSKEEKDILIKYGILK